MAANATIAFDVVTWGALLFGHCTLCGRALPTTTIPHCQRCGHLGEPMTGIWTCGPHAVAWALCHRHLCTREPEATKQALDALLRQRYSLPEEGVDG